MTREIRVVLVDDETILRAGLKALIDQQPDMRVVGGAGTGAEALEMVAALRPDVVVMDLTLPGMDGLEITRRLTAMDTGARVLVLTARAGDDALLPVVEAGGSGYVHKTDADEDLISAIRVVAAGEVFLYPSATRRLLDAYQKAEQRGRSDPLEPLSTRERRVLALAAEGYSAAEIGKKLFLSPKTVETYRSRLTRKLGIQHRVDLVHFALRTGLLKED
jgi:two-component system, NarL family, response regulator NreC